MANLQEWINDASAYELLHTYKVDQQVLYEFVNRSDDFYITLLNRFFFTLREEDISADAIKEKLLQLVKGLMVYSDDNTADNFKGVNRHNNLLYIAAIYFICEYYALSHLFMWKASRYRYATISSQLLYCILAGSSKYVNEDNALCQMMMQYMQSGDERVLNEIRLGLEGKIAANDYANLDDFYDTYVALKVMERFRSNNLWKDLAPHGGADFWREYIDYSVRHHVFSLLPSQEDAIQKGLLDFDRSFSLKMPTSAGKTFLTELLVYQEIKKNPEAKILYLAPLRSLSRELKERYGSLSAEFGFDFRAAYGGCTTSAEEETIEKAKLLIATPETFTTLEGTMEDLSSKYTLVICDEGQLLEDKSRGVSYELLLTRLKRNLQTRFLFISAIIPNISQINTWLGGNEHEVGDSDYRPCKIRFALAQKNENRARVLYANDQIRDWSVTVDDFLTKAQMGYVTDSLKTLSCALSLKAMDAGPVMLYCSMKDGNRGCLAHVDCVMDMMQTGAFKNPASLIPNAELLEKTAEYCAFQLGKDYRLTQCVSVGVAYHHGQMPQDLREVLEVAISRRAIQLVVCTKTLSEGINMPIKTAVLANVTNPSDGTFKKTLEHRDLKNIVGRVGRAGKESYGLVIVPVKGRNNEAAAKIVSILQGEQEERANGALFYIVQDMLKENLTSDEEINAYLETEGVAEQIDTLINLNKDDAELDDINLDEIIQESLAHYLGDENVKQEVQHVFRIRYAYIRNTLPTEEYGKYLQIGLPLTDYNELKAMFAEKTTDDFDIQSATDGGWIHLVMETIYSMSSIKRDIAHVSKTKPLYKVHADLGLCEHLLVAWLSGKQYVEMSEETGCTVEQAALYVDFLQRSVSAKVQSVVAYIKETFEMGNPLLDIWPEIVKRGVSDQRALYLVDSGLGDRSLVNLLVEYAEKEFPWVDDKEMFLDEIQHSTAVDAFVMAQNIPVLLKERWKQYLRTNSIV